MQHALLVIIIITLWQLTTGALGHTHVQLDLADIQESKVYLSYY